MTAIGSEAVRHRASLASRFAELLAGAPSSWQREHPPETSATGGPSAGGFLGRDTSKTGELPGGA
jgi:hypothetical protein